MNLYNFSFEPEGDHIELVSLGDLHIGASTFKEKSAYKHREYILDSPDRKVIELGDHIENGLRDSPGRAVYDQTMSPKEQRDAAKDYFAPLAGRVLGICASNHSGRSERTADISPDELLAAQLGCPEIRWEAILSITVGNSTRGHTYNVWVRHGCGNPTTRVGLLTKLQRKVARVQGCDAYLVGHSHTYMHEPMTITVPDARHGKVKVIEQQLCASDSFLEWDDSYAEELNYERPVPGKIALKLYRDRREMEVLRLLP